MQGPREIPAFRALQMSVPQSLADAVEAARSYISSCSDPESLAIEPEVCAKIGGHVHVATITPDAGFQWAIPPLLETIK